MPDGFRGTLSPRPHDLVSYGGTLVAFVGIALWRGAASFAKVSEHLPLLVGGLLFVVHFIKRIVECVFVHRYGDRRVTSADALGEYLYYWTFAIWIAWSLASCSTLGSFAWVGIGTVLFLVGQIGNGWSHLVLRHLRASGTAERQIPRGGAFELVSCPNYLFEIASWIGFAIVARTWATICFLVAASVILAFWAKKRHDCYHLLFDGRDGRELYPRRRKAIVPFVF